MNSLSRTHLNRRNSFLFATTTGCYSFTVNQTSCSAVTQGQPPKIVRPGVQPAGVQLAEDGETAIKNRQTPQQRTPLLQPTRAGGDAS